MPPTIIKPNQISCILYRDAQRRIEFDRAFDIEELRADTVNGKRTMSGHAIVFNQETSIGGWYIESVAKGAARKTLKEFNQAMVWGHDVNKPIARRLDGGVNTGALKMKEEDAGLYFTVSLPDEADAPTWINDAYRSIKLGHVYQMSFGFSVTKVEWILGEGEELDKRIIKEIKLYEISPVTFPAYDGTDVAVDVARSIVQDAIERGELIRDTTSEPVTNNSETPEPDEVHSEAGNRESDNGETERESMRIQARNRLLAIDREEMDLNELAGTIKPAT